MENPILNTLKSEEASLRAELQAVNTGSRTGTRVTSQQQLIQQEIAAAKRQHATILATITTLSGELSILAAGPSPSRAAIISRERAARSAVLSQIKVEATKTDARARRLLESFGHNVSNS